MCSIHDLRHELVDRDLAPFSIGWRRVLSVHRESLPFPHGRAVPLVDDFDVDNEVHFPFGHRGRAHARQNRKWDIGVVSHDAPTDERIGRLFGGDAESEAPLERLPNSLAHLLRERWLRGVVFEWKDRDRLDVGKRAALESVGAAKQAQAPGASDDYATEPAE